MWALLLVWHDGIWYAYTSMEFIDYCGLLCCSYLRRGQVLGRCHLHRTETGMEWPFLRPALRQR